MYEYDDDCGKSKMERSSEILSSGTPTTAQNVVVPSYPGSRTPPPEAADDGMVLLVVGGTDAPSAATRDSVTYSYPHVAIDLLSSSAVPTATRSGVPYNYWTATARLPAYPDVVVMAPAPRSSVPYSDVLAAHLGPGASAAAGPVVGESYSDMLVAHLGSDMPPAAWNKNNVAHPASATASAAINGVATAYPGPGGLSLNVVTARPDTNAAVGLGYAIDAYQGVVATDLGSEHLHPTGAAAAAAEQGGGYYYYYNNSSGMVPHVAVSQYEVVAGAAAGPVRGGGDLGGLGLAATSLATAGLIAGGVDAPMTAIVLFGMLIAGVILVTVRMFRA